MSEYLEIDQIEVVYGQTTALHALSLAIKPGEFFCLLGPSGCGKSTTLNVVAGFLKLSGGRVRLAGKDITTLPPQRRQMGIVFQSYALFPHMTVAENIAYGLRIRKLPKPDIDARIAELIRLVRLDGKSERYPRQLSGGEQQRVAIGRALAIKPDLLLLDEPLSNLDARLREEMRNELKRIQRSTGVTTIFVTHDQEEAFGAADRIAVMNLGRLEQLGTPMEIYQSPASTFVARFIGRSNIVAGSVADHAGTPAFEAKGHRFHHSKIAPGKSQQQVLYLRPESMTLSSNAEAVNSLPAEVTDIVYGGTTVTYRVATDLGPFEVTRLTEGDTKFRIGDRLHVGWSANAGVLLADDRVSA